MIMRTAKADEQIRIFGSPGRYVQGPGALDLLPQICAGLGAKVLLVVDADVLALVNSRLSTLFTDRPHVVEAFRGEVTRAAMDGLAAVAKSHGADVVAGIGGGKTLDAGKGCAQRTGTRFVSVPTIASNDSPTATALAVYDDNHHMIAVESLGRNPEAVVVDTRLIASAPARFLLAGMGDALAKKFEGEASVRAGGLNAHYSTQPRTAGYIADGCYRTIREHGEAAMAVAGTGEPNAALEAVVEANILMAGLAFENMGLGVAHGLCRGLVRTPQVERAPHGFHVAYGLLVQLASEGRTDAMIEDMLGFYKRVGLPRSLTQLGMERIERSAMEAIAASTAVAPAGAYLVVPVGAEALVAAIEDIERRFLATEQSLRA